MPGAPADKLDLLKRVDKFSEFRDQIEAMSRGAGEWAGMPMPMADQELVVHPSYPFAEICAQLGKQDDSPPLPDDVTLRNVFWSSWRRCRITVWNEGGKVRWSYGFGMERVGMALQTIGASYAWGIEQEARALQLLGTLVGHHTFKMYLLTGMFLETSKRTGKIYLFRKLRPTLVLDNQTQTGGMRVLCALCLHPIAYYATSWAGAMCPTDDVIAHLMLMRGDEVMFWRRANQHPPDRPEAGL